MAETHSRAPARLDDLIDYVNAQHPAGDPLVRLSDAMFVSQRLGEVADQLIGHYVDQARRSGATWNAIGEAMGVTKQAAQKRFAADLPGFGRGEVPLDRFTARARTTIAAASREAAAMSKTQAGPEHLLLGLLSEPGGMAAQALAALGATPEQIRERAGAGPAPAPAADPRQLPLSDRAKVALGRGFHAALQLGHNYIGTEHILLGLLADTKGAGATILGALGITEQRARDWLTEAIDDLMTARAAENTTQRLALMSGAQPKRS
jgi:Clp amino terminal domain, pathogenicity island component